MKAPRPIYEEEWDHIYADDIEKVGIAIFGERWKCRMAAALSVRVGTIEGWIDGRLRIPRDATAMLSILVEERFKILLEARDMIGAEERSHKLLFGEGAQPVKSIRRKKPWVDAPIDRIAEYKKQPRYNPPKLSSLPRKHNTTPWRKKGTWVKGG